MSVKVKEKIAILESNGCKLLESSQYPKSCNSKVDILCNCGHTRRSVLTNIIVHEQFKCKDCIKIKKSTNIKLRKSEYKNKFEKTRLSFENRYIKSNKYRDDFSPENIDKTLQCRECKINKPLYRFYNRRRYNDGKEKLCRTCEMQQKKNRLSKHTNDQIVNDIISSCKRVASARKSKGRNKCGEVNIDLDYINSLLEKQNYKCVYTNKELEFVYNTTDKVSMDRIDSTKGYIKGNVQLVCSIVNWMKLDMCEKEFLRIINELYTFKETNVDETNHIDIDDRKINQRVPSMIKTCRVSARTRKTKRGRAECGIVNIDKKYIIDLIKQQNNRCVYSGIEFDWDEFKNNPYQASIDRIDNDKGYIKGNVQIVCNSINQMKSNLTDNVFMDYVSAIYKHRCIHH